MRKPQSYGTGLMSHTARYALRIVAELARIGADRPFRAHDIQKTTGVPPHYLPKVLRRLVLEGVLRSQRGHHGGFALARPAAEITVADVLSAVGSLPDDSCAFGWGECNANAPCPLHAIRIAFDTSFMQWARNTTFANVLDNAERHDALTPCKSKPK
ncbi:MAG: Rrf2 family transcriptional regulator [Deltaproteobacteria bacterium]|nr:Rrf2 family transcriptional regulator [Deltaproteobacteria bacterium]